MHPNYFILIGHPKASLSFTVLLMHLSTNKKSKVLPTVLQQKKIKAASCTGKYMIKMNILKKN